MPHTPQLSVWVCVVHPLTHEPWGVRRFFRREPNGKVLNILSHA